MDDDCEVERMQAGEVGAANRAKSDLLFASERGVSRGRESDGVTDTGVDVLSLALEGGGGAEGER